METESMAGVRPDGGTRAQLLAITERLMSAAGYEGVAIKDIAAVAGVRPAAIFYHFPTKADLVAAALDASVKALAGRLAELDGQHADPMARVRAFIDYFGAVKRARNEFPMRRVGRGEFVAQCPRNEDRLSSFSVDRSNAFRANASHVPGGTSRLA